MKITEDPQNCNSGYIFFIMICEQKVEGIYFNLLFSAGCLTRAW